MRSLRLFRTLPLVLLILSVGAPSVFAATYEVSNTADTAPASPCGGLTGCSLREAVTSAEANAGPDTITIVAGTYTLTNGQLSVTEGLTIEGAGTGLVTIDAGTSGRAFNHSGSNTFTVRNLTITGGYRTGGMIAEGGAILSIGTALTLESVSITDCVVEGALLANTGGAIRFVGTTLTIGTAVGAQAGSSFINNRAGSAGVGSAGGGAISASAVDVNIASGTLFEGNSAVADNTRGGAVDMDGAGPLTITETTFRNNSATTPMANAMGGAIYSTVTTNITGSTFSGNSATGGDSGGAIKVYSSPLTIFNSTIVNNTLSPGASGGAAIHTDDNLLMTHTTVTGNTGPATVVSTGMTMGHSIISGNTGLGATDECTAFVAGYYNVVPVGGCDGTTQPSDIEANDPKLLALGDFGGETETMPPTSLSPALNIEVAGSCATTTDQRGIARPQQTGCDAGAVEARGSLSLAPDPRTFATTEVGQSATASVTVTLTGDLGQTITAGDLNFTGTNASEFSYDSGCAAPVAAAGNCALVLKFTPTSLGPKTATVTIDLPVGSDSATLSATAATPRPTFSGTSPASPGDDLTPLVKGTAWAGSTVQLFTSSDCSGTPVATGSAASFAAPGIEVAVAKNSTTTFYAKATSVPGGVADSACSTASVSYTHTASTTPTTPTGKLLNPPTVLRVGKTTNATCQLSSGTVKTCTIEARVRGKVVAQGSASADTSKRSSTRLSVPIRVTKYGARLAQSKASGAGGPKPTLSVRMTSTAGDTARAAYRVRIHPDTKLLPAPWPAVYMPDASEPTPRAKRFARTIARSLDGIAVARITCVGYSGGSVSGLSSGLAFDRASDFCGMLEKLGVKATFTVATGDAVMGAANRNRRVDVRISY